MTGMHDGAAVAGMILSGRPLLLAGDEALLAALPKGNWIGGTIPYFMAGQGGIHTAEHIFVTELPSGATAMIRRYDAAELEGLAADYPEHGFTVLLLPAFSAVHGEFAKGVAHYPGIFDRPLVGWVSGVALGDIGKISPKVFDGSTGTATDTQAVALHVSLPAEDQVAVDIINLFRQGDGAPIIFPETGFSARDVVIDGRAVNLARYLAEQGVDTRLPLVADYSGAMVNVSIRKVDAETGTVDFYAPVFGGVEYRLAAPVGDYVAGFNAALHADASVPTFSCNCILNYVHAGLEGRSTAPLVGPVTFGEIAYMLLNQTAVYLTVTRGG